jgi:hypothetical protein
MRAAMSASTSRGPPSTSAVHQPVKRMSSSAWRTAGQSTSPSPILQKPFDWPQSFTSSFTIREPSVRTHDSLVANLRTLPMSKYWPTQGLSISSR